MPKVKTVEKGRLILPDAFFQRRHMPSNIEYWLDERESDLVLHPCLLDARKLYIQLTTGVSLYFVERKQTASVRDLDIRRICVLSQ
jgi:hypothetical protein